MWCTCIDLFAIYSVNFHVGQWKKCKYGSIICGVCDVWGFTASQNTCISPGENVWEKLLLRKIRLLVIETDYSNTSSQYTQPKIAPLLKDEWQKWINRACVLKYCNGNERQNTANEAVGAYITRNMPQGRRKYWTKTCVSNKK